MPDARIPPFESKTVPISIVDKGFIEALQHWKMFTNSPQNEELKGKKAELYFLQNCRMPKTPSRAPTQAEFDSLNEVVAKVSHYRNLAQSDPHTWTRYWNSMGERQKEFLLLLGQTSDTVCVKYLKEAFLLAGVDSALPEDFSAEGIKEMYGLQGNLNGIADAANINIYDAANRVYETVDDVLGFRPKQEITYQDFQAEQALRRGNTPPEMPPDPGNIHMELEPPEIPPPPEEFRNEEGRVR